VSSHGHRFCKLAWIDDRTVCSLCVSLEPLASLMSALVVSYLA
jgi:hypothetical protein